MGDAGATGSLSMTHPGNAEADSVGQFLLTKGTGQDTSGEKEDGDEVL